MLEKFVISFSGGRTSAYMTKLLLDNWGDRYEFVIVFANTGLEHPKTLDFIAKCDLFFGFNTVWVEAVVHKERISPTHKIVNYHTAARNGEPFEKAIEKYGIPNTAFPGCTRDLKLSPIKSYLKSIDIDWVTVPMAIGIRDDERRRVKDDKKRNIVYPLVNEWPTDKSEILEWWKQQVFDLEIEEFEGNCKGCFKKSNRKHFMQIERDPSAYDFHRKMENIHRFTGPQKGQRVFFRGNLDTVGLFALYEQVKGAKFPPTKMDEDGGCSESCELFETEVLPDWMM
jgi:hypothetical protein